MWAWSRFTLLSSTDKSLEADPSESIQGNDNTATRPFRAPWWLRHPHLQTLWPFIFRNPGNPAYQRERIELPDGDFIDVDWYGSQQKLKPIIILLHGLEGSSNSHYMRAIVQHLDEHGWRCAIMHFRGCSGEPNRLPQSYHSGDTADLDYFIRLLKSREPATPLAALGYSLGGNVLLKWCGETGSQCPLQTAIAVSVPFDLTVASKTLDSNTGFSAVYRWWMLRNLKRAALKKVELGLLPAFREEDVKAMCSFAEFDNKITAIHHGFSSASEYYRCASSKPWLEKIHIPTLILHARDDPFMDVSGIPEANELSDSVHMELTDHGGHVGFFNSQSPLSVDYWLDKRIPAHFRTYLE